MKSKKRVFQILADGSDRVPKFVMPVIQDRLANGQSIWLSTAIVASFAKFHDGVDETGKKIEIVDRMKHKLAILAQKLKKDSSLISKEQEIFGDLASNKAFVEAFKEIYGKLQEDGSEKTLDWLLAKS